MNPDPMRDAIEATHCAIQKRARLYRKLMMCVSFILLASLVSAIVIRRAAPLFGILLLVPLSGTYFVVDSRFTRRWTRQVAELWAQRKLDLETFATAIRAHPLLPRGAVDGMLMGLPRASHETPLAFLSDHDRKALIDRLEQEANRQERRTMLATAALLSALACLGAGALLRSSWLLICSAVSLVLWISFRRTQVSN
jgi:hypothetical protein